METINDIVREMRKDMPRVIDAKVILRNYADRIEAAILREREAVGNVAAMREVLDEIRVAAMSDYEPDADYLIEKCNAALGAPPRNCDIYRTKKERDAAYKKYREYVILSSANPYVAQDEMMSKEEWLIAEVKGETK
jgi:hypothetical protein